MRSNCEILHFYRQNCSHNQRLWWLWQSSGMELAYPLNFASLLIFLAEGFSRGIALHWNPQNGCLLQMLQAVLFYSLLAFMSNIWTPSLFFSLSERKFTLLTCNSEFFKLHFNCNLEINWQKRLSKLTNSEKKHLFSKLCKC